MISVARVNVYIDGLNLYNGALRDTPYRWLNLCKPRLPPLANRPIPTPSAARG